MLTVVYPHNCALGGDLFAVVRHADGDDRVRQRQRAGGRAPARPPSGSARTARRRCRSPGPTRSRSRASSPAGRRCTNGGAARSWPDTLRDAIAYAEGGIPVARSLGDAIAGADLADPGLAGIFAPGGRRLATGDVLQQPALATTLRTLAVEGAQGLYTGPIAEALAAVPGVAITPADLGAYAVEVTPAATVTALGLDVHTSPPNASGVLLLQALALLDRLGADAPPLAVAELFRLGAADRDASLGDPRDGAPGAGAFLGPEHLDDLLARARGGRAPVGVQRHPRPTGDTVAVVATDDEGRAVSLIQSLFHGFGSGILEPSTGIILHNRGAFFRLATDHPNTLAPGRRPAHTLLPVLVTDPATGALRGALGTMGGRVHAQILTQVLLALLAGEAPQDAVDAPRWIVGGMELGEADDTVRVEDGVDPDVRDALAGAGDGVPVVDEPRGSEWLGHAQAIWAGVPGSDRRADP